LLLCKIFLVREKNRPNFQIEGLGILFVVATLVTATKNKKNMTLYDQYETVIGLETHVQLSTNSKAFCADSATFGGSPNTHISAISLGHPGTLPRLNKRQIEFAIRLGLALGCEINQQTAFDRKNYFYTDLPKGYQITQDRAPICIGGSVEIEVGGETKIIRLHHIHMEEDAGKSIHDQDPENTLVDLNRAGVPLLEIVSEPDLRSGEEVDVFMSAMRQLVRYLEISDGNMQEGSLRCDCNVSVRLKGAEKYGERCEVKNMNSMRNARNAIKFETNRQIDLIESGGQVQQQTLNFDPVTGRTSPLRTKENAHDYRYFADPDLPPMVISDAQIERIKTEMPPLPKALRQRLMTEFKLNAYDTNLLTEEKATVFFFLNLAENTSSYKAAANLIINKINPFLQENKMDLADLPISVEHLAGLIRLIDEGKVNNTTAYQQLFPAMIEKPNESPEALAKAMNLIQSADEDFLRNIVEEVVAKFPDKVKVYQKGKKGLIGFFMGEVMRAAKGKAEPKATNALLREILEKK
jgi:aspartyl-tRNA(Asn)/glutamyl-tRNA(Gln) amidotransferase subunit B